MPPARLEQFAIDVPDIGPQWAADQIFLSDLPLIVSPVIFLVKLNRIMSITITQPDKRSYCVTGMNRSRRRLAGATFYGGDLDGISEKLPYLKNLA